MVGNKSKDIFYLAIIGILILAGGYLVYGGKNQTAGGLLEKAIEPTSSQTPTLTENTDGPDSSGTKTFVFDSFHGADLGNGVFTFQYPATWHNDGQYFSPIPIKYYDLVSVDAPVYFDLVSTLLFDTGDVKYQITNDKRAAPDTVVKIDGKTFNRYDLIDYGSSGGESTGRVIIYLGPKITFGGDSYYLVFRWEENPLTSYIPGNDPAAFEKMVSTVKFR